MTKLNENSDRFSDPSARQQVEPEVITTGDDAGVEGQLTGSVSGGGDENPTVSISNVDAGWSDFFPFDEPYADQVDGINAYIETLANHENMVMEGACGTGKTLVGLTAGAHCLRNLPEVQRDVSEDAPEYSRILVATPVKQQLKQFIDEMKTINKNLNGQKPLSTVVMRGQGDVLPYAFVDYAPFHEYHVSAKIDDLRKRAIDLIKFGSDIPLQWPDNIEVPEWSYSGYNWGDPSDEASEAREQYKFDPFRAEAVMETLKARVSGGAEPLVVNGVEAPYPDGIPHTNTIASTEGLQERGLSQLPADLQGKFDPFFVGFFAYEGVPFWFNDAPDWVMDSDALFELSVSAGICPHQAMADMMEHADVLIGNYYHVFDPDTRLLTDMKTKVLDEDTICVLDEAHNIEERVRDILSDAHGIHSFRYAINDVRTALGYLNGDPGELPRSEASSVDVENISFATPKAESVMESPGYSQYTEEDFREVIELFNYLNEWLKDKGDEYLDDRFRKGWEFVASNNPSWIRTEDIPLEDPENDVEDELYKSIEKDFDDDIWETVYMVSRACQEIIEEIDVTERVPECESVGEFFYRWANESHVEYFREIVLEARPKEKPLAESHGWTREWTPRFQLYNCIPTRKLREVFSELGSALLMSATLEPVDEYVSTTGIGKCVSPYDVEDKEERAGMVRSGEADAESNIEFRDVTVKKYPMRFPQSNRLSLTVTAPKYTYSNRGNQTPRTNEMKPVRKQYMNLLVDVAESNGNVLLSMPSYGEASWAKDVLERAGVNDSKNIILDESSSSTETDKTLTDFFSEGESVIITSTRGTITEGVDYAGDKLHTCAVIGLSLLPPQDRNKAVQAAYDEYLDNVSGFEATNKIPAVRKARQAFGRVIRGDTDVGTRILIDERYADSGWSGVKDYLSEQEKSEFSSVNPGDLQHRVNQFWNMHQG